MRQISNGRLDTQRRGARRGRRLTASLATVAALCLPAVPASAAEPTSTPAPGVAGGVLSEVVAAADATSQAIAAACNRGSQIFSPDWRYVEPDSSGLKTVIKSAAYYEFGRDLVNLASGLAILDRELEVVACTAGEHGPLPVPADGLFAVSYLTTEYAAAVTAGDLQDYTWLHAFHIGRTTGQPPANASFDTALTITSLPYSHTADRYLAPQGPDNGPFVTGTFCGSSGGDEVFNSVWYRFTPAATGPLTIEGATQIGVVTPSGLVSFDCLEPRPTVFEAGRTYVIQVGDYHWSGAGVDGYALSNGSPTELRITGSLPLGTAPTAAVTVSDRVVTVKARGVTVRGTVTCQGDVGSVVVSGTVVQGSRGARFSYAVRPAVTCNGTAQDWTAVATPTTGRFNRQLVTVAARASLSGPAGEFTSPTVTVQARTSKARKG